MLELLHQWFKSLFRTFTPLERVLIQALIEALPADASQLLRAQVAQVKKVERLGNWCEVWCIYRRRLSARGIDDPDEFPVKRELELARIHFRVAGHEGQWEARFFAVGGRFRTLLIRPSPRPVSECAEIEIVNVELRGDPMDVIAVTRKDDEVVKLTGWVREWFERYDGSDVAPPLDEKAVCNAVAAIEASLPMEYWELQKQTDGMTLYGNSHVVIFGFLGIDEIHLEADDFYRLAEIIDDGGLAVRRRDYTGTVYFLSYSGADPEPVSRSFRRAVEKWLE